MLLLLLLGLESSRRCGSGGESGKVKAVGMTSSGEATEEE